MPNLIASPFLSQHLLLRQGSSTGVRISAARYHQLADAQPHEVAPPWLTDLATRTWGINLADQDGPDDPSMPVHSPRQRGGEGGRWASFGSCGTACAAGGC
jgi:hypothetical protein